MGDNIILLPSFSNTIYMASFVDRLKFKDVFAAGVVGAVIYAWLAGVAQSEIVIGAEIAVVTLIAQFYFRKKDKP